MGNFKLGGSGMRLKRTQSAIKSDLFAVTRLFFHKDVVHKGR